MGAILRVIFQAVVKYALPVGFGIGAGAVMDKVAADKLPSYPKEGIVPALTGDPDGKTSIPKIIYILAAVTLGGLVAGFVIKKLRIKI